jgi:hypothetical protein
MKKHFASITLALFALVLAGACNGGNEITSSEDGRQATTPTTPVTTPIPRTTPHPCRQFPSECD